MNNIHLQSVGPVKAIQASKLIKNQVIVFNYGLTHKVLSIVESSKKFVTINLDDGTFFRANKNKLIGVQS